MYDLKPFFKRKYKNNLISWKELETLINIRPLMTTTRVKPVNDDTSYTWSSNSWMLDVNTFPPSVIEKMIKKHTCYLADCSRFNKNINDFCKELEEKYNRPVDAHIFFAKVVDKGFGVHCDYSHNTIVQCEGKTNFKVWDILKDPSTNPFEVPDIDPVIDVVMEKGDMLFVPARMLHHGQSITERVSISFPFEEITDADERYFEERNWVELCTN